MQEVSFESGREGEREREEGEGGSFQVKIRCPHVPPASSKWPFSCSKLEKRENTGEEGGKGPVRVFLQKGSGLKTCLLATAVSLIEMEKKRERKRRGTERKREKKERERRQ